jgi:hypothetical protein
VNNVGEHGFFELCGRSVKHYVEVPGSGDFVRPQREEVSVNDGDCLLGGSLGNARRHAIVFLFIIWIVILIVVETLLVLNTPAVVVVAGVSPLVALCAELARWAGPSSLRTFAC